ncbi:10218_t:CDS:2 [Ambispora leptoticha]|uniref:10218_t:CDS:1 n=1 Tax=Ambispora leptoticha TaxID=144679 RepID=A0A9N9GVV9_9GLOM|nr:10218_t:CDS:2 [Ambispora leptoticha]
MAFNKNDINTINEAKEYSNYYGGVLKPEEKAIFYSNLLKPNEEAALKINDLKEKGEAIDKEIKELKKKYNDLLEKKQTVLETKINTAIAALKNDFRTVSTDDHRFFKEIIKSNKIISEEKYKSDTSAIPDETYIYDNDKVIDFSVCHIVLSSDAINNEVIQEKISVYENKVYLKYSLLANSNILINKYEKYVKNLLKDLTEIGTTIIIFQKEELESLQDE